MSWKNILKAADIIEEDLIDETRKFMKGYSEFYNNLEVGKNINQYNKDNLKILIDRVDIEKESNFLRCWELKKHTKKVVSAETFAEIDKLWKESFGKLFN
jgi:hypothetical protein|tara:strand:+ start:395 stop:694 length:300 start_codon:yes stop_codon:yes gene_type:complete